MKFLFLRRSVVSVLRKALERGDMSDRRRFREFTAEEILELWVGLVYEDGIPYDPEPGTPEATLVAELENEWSRRLPHSWGVSLTQAYKRNAQSFRHPAG